MNGPTAIRVAALVALGYGLWVLASGPVHIGGGAGGMTMRVSAGHWAAWLVGLLSLLLACGLWLRQAWSWWLALAAALIQAWRLLSAHFAHGGLAHLPNVRTMVVLMLLLSSIVLLLMPKARVACNR